MDPCLVEKQGDLARACFEKPLFRSVFCGAFLDIEMMLNLVGAARISFHCHRSPAYTKPPCQGNFSRQMVLNFPNAVTPIVK